MALGIQSGSGGDIKPFVKYDARAGRMFRMDRVQDSTGQWVKNQVDITNTAQFVVDLENIQVGWINYSEQGPIRAMAVLGKEPIPPRPEGSDAKGKPAFKQGFNLQIMLPKDLRTGDADNGVREFNSTAGSVVEAVDQLHDAFLAAPESKQGKLPVVRISEVVAVKSGQSTNYRPVFQVVAWTDRPASMGAPAPTNGNGSAPVEQRSAPPATGSTQVAPPQQKVPEAAGARDFG